MKGNTPSIFPALLIALLAGGLTLLLLFSLRADTDVVVAARPIQVGARLTEADLATKKIRAADALPGAIRKIDEAIGQVISAQRMAGDQITADMLGNQAISSIAASLAPDHRAVAVHVTRSAGLAGILRPGDLVSLIAIVEPPHVESALTSSTTLLTPTSQPSGSESVPPPNPTVPATTPTPAGVRPVTPFSRITASGLKVLLVPQTFRYEEVTATDSQGFALAQSSLAGQNEGVIVLDVPATPITVAGLDGPLTISLPELIGLLDSQARVYLALEPSGESAAVSAPGIAIEQLVDLGVGAMTTSNTASIVPTPANVLGGQP